jgi:hypothetical protein
MYLPQLLIPKKAKAANKSSILPESAYLPAINDIPKARRQMVEFRGYNARPVIGRGELSAMTNLSGDNYPVLTVRPPREVVATLTKANGLMARESLAYVDGTKFYYQDIERGTVSDGTKTMIAFNQYILIFPDKKYYNVENQQFGSLEKTVTVTASLTFAADSITLSGVDTTGFNVGDTVKISGCTVKPENNKYARLTAVGATKLTFPANTFVACTETGDTTIARLVPDMSRVCEHENRVWGCYVDRTIYASKLGNPFNWYQYEGVETDSYAVDVGTDGGFTGICKYENHVIFFKPDHIHELYGYKPSNFQIITNHVEGLGIPEGAHDSIVVVGGAVYYLSESGFARYTGSTPQVISDNLNMIPVDAEAGTDGRKVYFTCRAPDSQNHLFVYDPERGFWFREDNLRAVKFASDRNTLYCIGTDHKLYKFNSGAEEIAWNLETEDFSVAVGEKQKISKIKVTAELAAGSSMTVSASYDHAAYVDLQTVTTAEKKTFAVLVIPHRAEFVRIKVAGTGAAKIYGLELEFAMGGDA